MNLTTLSTLQFDYELLTSGEFYEKDNAAYNDFSFHKSYVCINHTGQFMSSKCMGQRSLFLVTADLGILWERMPSRMWAAITGNSDCTVADLARWMNEWCNCDYSDFRVIYPVGGYGRKESGK